MENKEFKRIWEKEGKRLFALEQKKGTTKCAPDTKKKIAKEEPRHSFPTKRKNTAFSGMF